MSERSAVSMPIGVGRRAALNIDTIGWLCAGLWLIFLIPSIVVAWRAEAELWARVATVGVLAVFAVVYLNAFRTYDQDLARTRLTPRVAWHLAILMALSCCTIPLLGISALGTLPFTAAFATFALPLRWLAPFLLTLFTGVAIVAVVTGELWPAWPLLMVVVAGGTGRMMQYLGHRENLAAHRAAMLDERERVARDVHDVLGHSLTVIVLKTALAKQLVNTDPTRACSELDDVESLGRQSLAELRTTVAGLRVARLEDEANSARDALRAAGIVAHIPADTDILEPRLRITAAWVLREAVTNIVRHSGATQTVVEWGADWISVSDDGVGLATASEGNGLRGLRERVEGLGGQLSVGAGPTGGTLVRADL